MLRTALPETRFNARMASSGLVLFAILVIATLHVCAALRFAGATWDDSAITLGFARSFALTGEIRPTPLSDRVEGYSTPLWMLINAAAYAVLRDPGSLLAFAKVASLDLNLASFVLLFALLRRWCEPLLAVLLTAGFAAQPIAFYETVNGMEHPLFLFLMLASFWGYVQREKPGRYLAFLISSTLLVAIRWEAAWFLVPFALLTLAEGGLRRLLALEHVLWAFVFAGLSIFRRIYFGDWLPNTIIAKANPPYSRPEIIDRILSGASAVADLAAIILPYAALLLVFYAARQLDPSRRPPLRHDVAVAVPAVFRSRGAACAMLIILAAIILSAAVGRNWGPQARLAYPALPFAFILAALPLQTLLSAAPRITARAGYAGLAALAILGAAGAYRQLGHDHAPVYQPDVTVANVARIVAPLETLRGKAGLETISIASPDMGGLLLYGDRVRVIDIAMLCNRDLARSGLAGLHDVVFRREKPDVIQAHEVWSQPLQAIDAFFDSYVPVFVGGIRFFLRRDLAADLPVTEERFDGQGDTPRYDRSSNQFRHQGPHDFAINRRFGSYLVVDD